MFGGSNQFAASEWYLPKTSSPPVVARASSCYSSIAAAHPSLCSCNLPPQKDKKCNVAYPFAEDLPTGSGSYVWTPGECSSGAVGLWANQPLAAVRLPMGCRQ